MYTAKKVTDKDNEVKYELFRPEEAIDVLDKAVTIKQSIGIYEVKHLNELKSQYQSYIDEIDEKLAAINSEINKEV